MLLFRELLLAQLIADEEFSRKESVVCVANRAQLNLLDKLTIRNHHGHTAEESLKVLRKFLATGVTWVHRNKGAANWVKQHVLRVSRELEILDVSLLRIGDSKHLLRDDRENREGNAVEFVKAAPKASLAESLEDLCAIGVSHLISAISNNDKDTESTAHVAELRCSNVLASGQPVTGAELTSEGLTVGLVIEHGPGDVPDWFSVVVPDGFIAVPAEMTLEEGSSGVVLIFEWVGM